MIANLAGLLTYRDSGYIVVECGGLGYHVLLPGVVEKALEAVPLGQAVRLETIYYLQVEQTRATPVLLGFENAIQREFFEKLLTVPKMGPRGALSAFSRPLSVVAAAIEKADYTMLQTLPGVGKQKARDMVATLQGKVAKFALMQDAGLEPRQGPAQQHDVGEEALQLLVLLGHKRAEAERMVADGMKVEPDAADAEALVRVIYARRQGG